MRTPPRPLCCVVLFLFAAGAADAQLDFGESLESKKCSFANFQARVNEIEAACCTAAGSCQNGEAPTSCSIKCATHYVPFWSECFPIMAMVMGGPPPPRVDPGGHGRRRQLQAAHIKSVRSCKQLGWAVGAGSKAVCAESDISHNGVASLSRGTQCHGGNSAKQSKKLPCSSILSSGGPSKCIQGVKIGQKTWLDRNYAFMKAPGNLLSGDWGYNEVNLDGAKPCKTEGGFKGTLKERASVAICCANHCHKGNVPTGGGMWSAHPGKFSITQHPGSPCSFYQTVLEKGSHTVCCRNCWASGLFFQKAGGPMMTAPGTLCKTGFNIRSEKECIAAAHTLHKKWGNSWSGANDHPGCIFANDKRQKVYWNTNGKASKPRSRYSSICVTQPGGGSKAIVAVTQGYPKASRICGDVGARLCTAAELLSGEAKGTGCGHDSADTWSSTSCVDAKQAHGYLSVNGAGHGKPVCQTRDRLSKDLGVRCCADAVVPPQPPHKKSLKPWALLEKKCTSIDGSKLLLAIKDLSKQGCHSPALSDQCSDGWTLAASGVCFSAGGKDVQDDDPGRFSIPKATSALKLVHTAGGVTCRNLGKSGTSRWGCDTARTSFLGTLITQGCVPGTPCKHSNVVAPPYPRLGKKDWWWKPYHNYPRVITSTIMIRTLN
jgi:hypothetical protein